MKRLKNQNMYGFGGYDSYVSAPLPYSPPEKNDDETPYDPYDPKTLKGFEDYDYHLIYNDEEDLIGFTSHDGKISYDLIKDSFEDLVKIRVTTAKIKFYIALIWEFFDCRKNDPETDDKGKLTDVIILGENGEPLPEGFAIQPERKTVSVGDEAQFRALLTNYDGTTSDVTDIATWTINSNNMPIVKGKVTNAVEGNYNIMAQYDMNIAVAQLEVNAYELVIQPSTLTFEIATGETYNGSYKAYTRDGQGRLVDVTAECSWSTNNWNGSVSSGSYTVSANSAGQAQITATYQGKNASATLSGTVNVPHPPDVDHNYDYKFKIIWDGDDDVDFVARINGDSGKQVTYYSGKAPGTPTAWRDAISTYVDGTNVLALDKDDTGGGGTNEEMITVLGFENEVLDIYFNMYAIRHDKDQPITVQIYKLTASGSDQLVKTYTFTGSNIPDGQDQLKQVCELDLKTGTLTP